MIQMSILMLQTQFKKGTKSKSAF